MRKVSVVFGTRPEAIKLCPLILALRRRARVLPHVCVTAQHREMLDQILQAFEVTPDVDLNLMQKNQSLSDLTARTIDSMSEYLRREKPDMVIVQGDTTTTFCAALAAYYERIPVGHVEAGLRTYSKYSPFPEELNRVLTTSLADHHFAATLQAKENLRREGVQDEKIHVTGNTVIDALLIAVRCVRSHQPSVPGLPEGLLNCGDSPLVLITGHRRENFGDGLENICKAVSELAQRFPRTSFVYPVHLNPNVREPVFRILAGHNNVHLIEPLTYLPFVSLMVRSSLILTDSGGIQEEAPSLGKPVLVMRDTTERPEAVAAGVAKLIGTSSKAIVDSVSTLLTDPSAYESMSRVANTYGDGRAADRIADVCEGIVAG
ncbi:MAG: UDP-N-acetylglucosamine 2-epimerase (non-hydrolyzing) [Acidobacteriota bacterium]|nr:UDP-N-acetylglucosamine 2-epimerase (non-hydrolyzing) [Acidobacteriota bacterium]